MITSSVVSIVITEGRVRGLRIHTNQGSHYTACGSLARAKDLARVYFAVRRLGPPSFDFSAI